MAGTVSVNVTISVAFTGDISGNLTNPAVFTLATSPAQRVQLALAAAFNALTLPTGTRGLLIVPPAGSTNVKTLKGITGDQGFPIDLVNPTFIALPAAPGAIGILSAGTETIEIYYL